AADTLIPEADLQIAKTDNRGGSSITATVGTAIPGTTITYTIVVSNAGPSDAPGTVVADTFGGQLTGVSFTATASGGASGFTPAGTGNINDVSVNLPPGGSVTYTVHATIVSSAAGLVTNTATVTPLI